MKKVFILLIVVLCTTGCASVYGLKVTAPDKTIYELKYGATLAKKYNITRTNDGFVFESLPKSSEGSAAISKGLSGALKAFGL